MTALPLAVRTASIGRRVAAYAVDAVVACGIGIAAAAAVFGATAALGATAVAALASALAAGASAAAVWGLVYTAMQGTTGSVGQRALGLRLLDAAAPVPVGFWRALWRNAVWVLSCAILVGWFTPLFDATPRRQGWHDRAGRAIVVAVPATDASPAPAARGQGLSAVAAQVPAAVPAEDRSWFLAPSAAPAVAAAPVISPSAPVAPPLPPLPPRPAPVFSSPAAPATAPAAAVLEAPVAVAEASAPPTVAIPVTPPTRPIRVATDDTRSAPVVPPPAQRAALFDDAPVLAVLTWDDGTRMAVYGRTRYGRNPAVEPGIVSVPVRDETLSLSKTHFEIGGDPSGVWIADRHSTNGTVLVRDGGRHPLVPGVATAVRLGDRLELGDRAVIVGGA